MGKKIYKKGVEIEVDDTAPIADEQAEESAPEMVDFEEWHAKRAAQIPAHHHKEILKADFKGRKVPELATMAEFDEALKKYGVKLA